MAELDRFVAELTALLRMVNDGGSGLDAVTRLVELTQRVLGAVGVSFAEYGAGGGRVVAGSGDSAWAVGRPVDPTEPVTARLIAAGPIADLSVDQMPAELAAHLRGRGFRRMLGARAELAGQVVGTLHAYFREEGQASAQQRGLIAFLAATAGHLYADGRGLPVYADNPGLTAILDAVAVVGPDGRVRSWNSAAATMIGRPASAAAGQPLPVPIPGVGQVLDHQLPDGRWLRLLATERPGSPDRLVTMREVTEAHRQEQARDLFVAVTSHELRTPVTVIKGYADTLVDHWDELDETSRRAATDRLGERAGELARLVERLLAAVGDGAQPAGPELVRFDLGVALREAVDELPETLRRRVRIRLPTGLPEAEGAPAAIATVVSELVTNAGKYAPAESLIELSALADARTVCFRVADRGVGVRPEHVERAFERFWQAESGDQRRYGGVGLGLYLVRRMVERQNGWVSLRPREHGGTVAEVRLLRADLGPGEA